MDVVLPKFDPKPALLFDGVVWDVERLLSAVVLDIAVFDRFSVDVEEDGCCLGNDLVDDEIGLGLEGFRDIEDVTDGESFLGDFLL